MFQNCPLTSNRRCQGCSLLARPRLTASVLSFASLVARSSPPVICQIIWLVPLGSPGQEPRRLYPNVLIPRSHESWMAERGRRKIEDSGPCDTENPHGRPDIDGPGGCRVQRGCPHASRAPGASIAQDSGSLCVPHQTAVKINTPRHRSMVSASSCLC